MAKHYIVDTETLEKLEGPLLQNEAHIQVSVHYQKHAAAGLVAVMTEDEINDARNNDRYAIF
jgi:hypothetical protein